MIWNYEQIVKETQSIELYKGLIAVINSLPRATAIRIAIEYGIIYPETPYGCRTKAAMVRMIESRIRDCERKIEISRAIIEKKQKSFIF